MHFSWFFGYLIAYFVAMNWFKGEKDFIHALASLYPEQEAKSIFFLMLNKRLGWNKIDYLRHQMEEINDQQHAMIQSVLAELKQGRPIQYIIGECDFFGLKFQVNPSVLIPRPETEELVQWILDEVKLRQLADPFILDMGTGSGCIPISLKHQLPAAKVFALDISTDSLATAQNNALQNGVEISFLEQDILQANTNLFNHAFDILVSNPPYVTEQEKTQMHANVLQFEPHTALFVTNEDPLLFYRAIADFALQRLKPNGLLFFEINEHLGQQTCDLLKAIGFNAVELRKDFLGRDRMIKASR